MSGDSLENAPKRALTEKQRRFIEVYAGNATEAARLAGYDGDDATLAQVGYENLRKPEIVNAIRSRGDDERQTRIATRIQRQQFWANMMNDPKADKASRLRASELLGKSERDFVERVEHTGADGAPIALRAHTLTEEELDAEILARSQKLLKEPKGE